MAKSGAVWGIDIGQCALKALRCRKADTPGIIVADAFDYIEYPKILSQPEADPAELIQAALAEFLSRNTVRRDRVAISVAGQSGLARFIKLPPVESKKIPDIVKYEAKQQIPFALEDVVWDYQQMAGGSVEEGFALETEVGLFAMKRDQVQRALEPFNQAGIEVDIVQLAPLSLYNFAAFDQMPDLPTPDEYDPDNPPDSLVVLSLGTDTTDLVITNGFRVWQRSVPLGGNHFTRALTKELKLTFAKAEHLKRNATQAEDPKAVFQAMRPVFNDLVTEVQRSIGYFSNIDRTAKLGRVLVLGGAMKLPGLQRYLSQNLGFEVARPEKFEHLEGPGVIDAPAFRENLLSFAPCYGLALQGLIDTKIRTNLLPRELIKDRMIRDKKPWAVGAAAALLLGMMLSSFGYLRQVKSADVAKFQSAISRADSENARAQQFTNEFTQVKQTFDQTKQLGDGLVSNVEGRRLWIELLKSINACLPREAEPYEKPVAERRELHIASMDCVKVSDLSAWFNTVSQFYQAPERPAPAQAEQPAAEAPLDGMPVPDFAAMPPGIPQPGMPQPGGGLAGSPSGEGWVFSLKGYHYHNSSPDPKNIGAEFVRQTLIKNLHEAKIPHPDDPSQEIAISDLGIGFAVVLDPRPLVNETIVDPRTEKTTNVRRFDFTVQFSWVETPPSKRSRGNQTEEPADDSLAAR